MYVSLCNLRITMNKPKITQELDPIYEQYIAKFAKKHGVEFEYAVSDDLSGPICFNNEYFFGISDIIYDVDNRLPAGLALKWHNDSLEHARRFISLEAYGKGDRYESLKETT